MSPNAGERQLANASRHQAQPLRLQHGVFEKRVIISVHKGLRLERGRWGAAADGEVDNDYILYTLQDKNNNSHLF